MSKKTNGRVLSILLVLVMVLSMLPAFSLASPENYERVTSASELTDGKYVLAIEKDGGFLAVSSEVSSNALTPGAVSPQDNVLNDPPENTVWQLTKNEVSGSFTLMDANGKFMYCTGSSNFLNVQDEPFDWNITDSGSGIFRIQEPSSASYTLAYNSGNSYNKFRTYKPTSLNAAYYADFRLFKLSDSEPEPQYVEVNAVEWDFEQETNMPSQFDSEYNAQAAIAREGGQAVTYPAGNGSGKAMSTTGWDGADAAEKYYAFTVDASQYRDMTLTVSYRMSNTGPRDMKAQYNVGFGWLDIPGSETSQANGSGWTTLAPVSIPEDADFAQSLKIRLIAVGTVSANGGTVASAGTCRIDDVVLTGWREDTEPPEPTPEPTPTPPPVVLPDDPTEHDPIAEIPQGAVGIKEVYAMNDGETGVTVIGQVAYKFSGNSILIQDLISDEIIGLQIYDYNNYASYNVGDVITVTGEVDVYGGVHQILPAGPPAVVDAQQEPFPAQELTIPQLLAGGDRYLSEYVVLREITLGTLNTAGSTPVTDAIGNTINIYRAAAYPDGVTQGSVVDIYACFSKFNATYQLRTGAASDYVNNANPSIPISVARALEAGTENVTVQGIVTFTDGRNVYIEDGTAGIDLYLNDGAAIPSAGDLVRATGRVAVYNGLLELADIGPEGIAVISSNNALPLRSVNIAELIASQNGDRMLESTRVKISGATIGALNPAGNTPLVQGGDAINIYRLPELDGIAEGDVVDVIAVVGNFNGFQLRVASAKDVTPAAPVIDPIPEIPDGVMSIPEVISAPDGDTVTVIGQLVYRYGNYDSINSAILEDVVDGEIVALQVYNALDDYEIGDVVILTASKTTYGGVPQVQSVTATESHPGEAPLIPAQEFASISEMLAVKDSLLSEYVMLKNVTLGAYNSDGATYITDEAGARMSIYRAASYPVGVEEGEVVDLYACLSKFNATDQLRVGRSTDYVVTNDEAPPVITLPSFLDAEVGRDYTVAIDVSDNVGVEGVTMTYTIAGTPVTLDMVKNPTSLKYQAVIPGEEIVSGNDEILLAFKAWDAKGNEAGLEARVIIVDQPQIVSVSPAPNSATYDDKRPVISVEFANAGDAPTAFLTSTNDENMIPMDVQGSVASYQPLEDLADGKHTYTVTVARLDGASVSYNWSFTVGEPQYSAYFGQLHSHTAQYSDSSGTLRDAYEYVLNLPESENVDFLAVTDHSNYFDSSSNLGDINDPTKGTLASDGTRTLWQEAQDTTDEYDAISDDVVFMYGYEMTWSGGPGHMNTFNTDGFVSRNNSVLNNKVDDAGMRAYYELLKQNPQTISMFNHPGTTFGTFSDFAYWDPGIDAQVTMIEVGNGEGAVGGSSYWPSYEYYQLALDKGWHLAPTNNQDNHRGKWGNANTARSVVITDDFTREGIYQAMRDMAMYSTEDHNLEINYTLNDNLMGSIISETPETVRIYASLSDPDASDVIGTVSVIVNGGVVAYTREFSSNSAVLDITLPCDYSYYYLRVEQGDGDIAVTAPVWTGEVSKVGITSVESDAVIPVRDEAMTITTSLYNYESSDLVIDSIVYSLRIGQGEFEVLETVENPLTVASMSEAETIFAFTPRRIGAQRLNVTVNATLNGIPNVFTYNLNMDVLDPGELLDIAIDAGHSNFYVSGNYPGSDSAFIKLCAQNGIRAHYVEEITYDSIKDMALLVMTVPFKSFGTPVDDSLYTADELNAIARYAASGGNIILCSKSDRGNPAEQEQWAHNISNEILEAAGATSRVANGIVVDNVEKANEAYRIYFTSEYNYNYDSPFLTDVLETTNNSFSCYNGAPVITGEGVTPIVKGYSTTWGANFTDDFGGSSSYAPDYDSDTVVVPMDEVVVMASEELSGGGWLLVSGVTFFSTFEVSVEVENSTTLQNSNYQIVMNIIDMLKPEPEISPITAVHEAEEGVRFTVEGVVTSNASGYDQDTAFFDCIYIQDEMRGVNLFPVSGDFSVGQKVRVTGVTSSYNGERQLAVSSIEVVDPAVTPVSPALVTAAEAMSPNNTGNLLCVRGMVKSLGYSSDGALETILVEDETGVANVFIDGYIMSAYTGLDAIKVGDSVKSVGIGSITVEIENPSGGNIPRMRVRDRSEITYESAEPPEGVELFGYSLRDLSEDADNYGWISFNSADPLSTVQRLFDGDIMFVAADYAYGTVYAFDEEGAFYAIDPETWGVERIGSNGGYLVDDMAFDRETGALYALVYGNPPADNRALAHGGSDFGLPLDLNTDAIFLTRVSLDNGALTELHQLDNWEDGEEFWPLGLACIGNGRFISANYLNDAIMLHDIDGNVEALSDVNGFISELYYQSMTYSPEDDTVYWAACTYDGEGYLVAIDPLTGDNAIIDYIGAPNGTEVVGLFVKAETHQPEVFDVTFIDGLTGDIIEVQPVVSGEDAIPPEPPIHIGYQFAGWDGDYLNITEARTITAMYEAGVTPTPEQHTPTPELPTPTPEQPTPTPELPTPTPELPTPTPEQPTPTPELPTPTPEQPTPTPELPTPTPEQPTPTPEQPTPTPELPTPTPELPTPTPELPTPTPEPDDPPQSGGMALAITGGFLLLSGAAGVVIRKRRR